MPQGVGVQLPPPAPITLREQKMEVKELKSKGLKREFSITIKSDVIKNLKVKKLEKLPQKQKLMDFVREKFLLLILKSYMARV